MKLISTSALSALVLLFVHGVQAELVALSMVQNSPVGYKLTSVNETTGELSFLGGDAQQTHMELAGTGDLCAIDEALGVWYYLGDTSAGTTLVGLSTIDGSEVCSSTVASLREIGIVGAGQSLDFDPSDGSDGSLILSGVSKANGTQHSVLRLKLTDGARRTMAARTKSGGDTRREDEAASAECGAAAFEAVTSFGDAAYLPFIHASALDVAGQRLFVTLQQGDDEVATNVLAVGVVDVSDGSGPGGRAPYYSIAMDNSGGSTQILFGIDFDAAQQRLVGVVTNAQNDGVNLRSLVVGSAAQSKASQQQRGEDPAAAVTWSDQPIADVPREWRYLSGNWGTVSSLDESGRRLYFEAGCCYSNKGTFLGVVDVDTAELQASPRFKGDMPLSSTGLTMMSHL